MFFHSGLHITAALGNVCKAKDIGVHPATRAMLYVGIKRLKLKRKDGANQGMVKNNQVFGNANSLLNATAK